MVLLESSLTFVAVLVCMLVHKCVCVLGVKYVYNQANKAKPLKNRVTAGRTEKMQCQQIRCLQDDI